MISTNEVKHPPKHIQDLINMEHKSNGQGYVFLGTPAYEYSIGNNYMVSSDVVLRQSTPNYGQKLNILDIGAGSGQFVLRTNREFYHVTCYGLSLHDLRHNSSPKQPTDYYYIVGNANKLADIQFPHYPSLEFDCIFSKYTFMHLADPIGAIVQAYDKLRPNGLLFIDNFLPYLHVPMKTQEELQIPPAIQNWLILMSLIVVLRKSAYAVTASPANHGICNFVIKKTGNNTILRFPLSYAGVFNKAATYTRDYDDSDIWQWLAQQLQTGKEILTKQIKKDARIEMVINNSKNHNEFGCQLQQSKLNNSEVLTAILGFINEHELSLSHKPWTAKRIKKFFCCHLPLVFQISKNIFIDRIINELFVGEIPKTVLLLNYIQKHKLNLPRTKCFDILDTLLLLAAILDIVVLAEVEYAKINILPNVQLTETDYCLDRSSLTQLR